MPDPFDNDETRAKIAALSDFQIPAGSLVLQPDHTLANADKFVVGDEVVDARTGGRVRKVTKVARLTNADKFGEQQIQLDNVNIWKDAADWVEVPRPVSDPPTGDPDSEEAFDVLWASSKIIYSKDDNAQKSADRCPGCGRGLVGYDGKGTCTNPLCPGVPAALHDIIENHRAVCMATEDQISDLESQIQRVLDQTPWRGLVPLTLVPVEVFGADECDHPGCDDERCPGVGHGLSDAVGPGWSDCNRAEGKIYRVDDLGAAMEPSPVMKFEGEKVRVRILVSADDVPFFDTRHGDPQGSATKTSQLEAVRKDARQQLENAKAIPKLVGLRLGTLIPSLVADKVAEAEADWRRANPGLSAVIGNG